MLYIWKGEWVYYAPGSQENTSNVMSSEIRRKMLSDTLACRRIWKGIRFLVTPRWGSTGLWLNQKWSGQYPDECYLLVSERKVYRRIFLSNAWRQTCRRRHSGEVYRVFQEPRILQNYWTWTDMSLEWMIKIYESEAWMMTLTQQKLTRFKNKVLKKIMEAVQHRDSKRWRLRETEEARRKLVMPS